MQLFGRFLVDGAARYGEVEGDRAHLLDDFWGTRTRSGEQVVLGEAEILAPVAPAKVLCVGLNYAEHIAEFGRERPASPLAWLKSPQAIIAHGAPIQIVNPEHRTDHEAELCVVIGRRCKNVAESEALDFVLGYTASQDISDRNVQKSESQWARAKSFDTYAPIGPFIAAGLDPQNLSIECRVNGEVRQNSHTRHMIFPVAHLIAFLSRGITLLPGDCILTGTPDGVGPLRAGDVVETHIGTLPPLVNPVENAA